MERIDQLHAEFDRPMLIEQYIEGREIYMGVLGNSPPEALPPVELDLSHLPKGTPRIAGTEVKWDEGTRAYRGSKVRIPKLPGGRARDDAALRAHRLPGARACATTRASTSAWRRGQGLPDRGESQPVPASGAEFIRGARASGRTHAQTIIEIVELARARYAGPPAR